MELWVPTYYRKFKCIADRCTHSCCVGWEIDVDARTLARYRALPDELGARICASIAEEGDGAHFVLSAGERCPHLAANGLCNIICELGEGYLCDICAEHPRFYNEVNGRMECGLGAACEAAAELILAACDYITMECIEGEDDVQMRETGADFDAAAWRTALFGLLSGKGTLSARLQAIAARFATPVILSEAARRELLDSLEYLDKRSRQRFLACGAAPATDAAYEAIGERFLAYLVYRHASAATNEREFRAAVAMALFLERLLAALVCEQGVSAIEGARLLSTEIEYCEENTDAIRAAFLPKI